MKLTIKPCKTLKEDKNRTDQNKNLMKNHFWT